MKKVAIVTMSGHYNYGNRLQNYALQETISNLGFNVETIWNEDCKGIKLFKIRMKHFINVVLSIFNIKNRRTLIKRYKAFKKFSDKNIHHSKYKMGINKIPEKLGYYYDYFVVGSDQIWNYSLFDITSKEFLGFSDYDKNIAYAPSIGVSSIPKEWQNFYYENLKNIKYLSCREKDGADIVKEITNRNCSVVLDPTLLLDKNDWVKISSKPENMTEKKYILLYFLGEKNNEVFSNIESFAKKNNFEIINFMDIKQKQYFSSGPSQFIYLFNHADFIFTDSFHACIFSMIFNKPFYVFDRNINNEKSMNSRLETLLDTFELRERFLKNSNFSDFSFDIDYNNFNEILAVKKSESVEFLKKSLK